MSKIAEQKALEAYSVCDDTDEFNRIYERKAYIQGYDQAMQDFLEKAEKFFNEELYVSVSDQICSVGDFTSMTNFIEQFKNYMQNESEN